MIFGKFLKNMKLPGYYCTRPFNFIYYRSRSRYAKQAILSTYIGLNLRNGKCYVCPADGWIELHVVSFN